MLSIKWSVVYVDDKTKKNYELTQYNPNGYPLSIFLETKDVKKWLDEKIKEVTETQISL